MKNRLTIVVVLLITIVGLGIVFAMQSGGLQFGAEVPIVPERSTQTSSSSSAQNLYERGVEAYWDKDKSVAIDLLTQVIDIDPNFAEAYAYRGASYRVDGYMDEAYKDFETALDIDPVNAITLSMMARWYLQYNNVSEAMNLANQSIELSPEEALVYYNRSRVYQAVENYDDAQLDLDKAISLDQSITDYYQTHGWNLLQLGRISEAIESLEIALELDPNNTIAQTNLIQAYAMLEHDNSAMQVAQSKIVSDPENVAAYKLLGLIYRRQGDVENANDAFDQVVLLDPTFDIDEYNLLSDAEVALEMQNLTIELDPTNSDVYYARALYYQDLGMQDEALDDYTLAIKYNPNDQRAYLNRGNIYRRRGEYDLAIADYNSAIDVFPQFGFAYWNRGIAYGYAGDYEQAIADYHTALTFNPRDYKVYGSLGIDYANMGDYEASIDAFEQSIELNPSYGRAYYGLGYTYDLMGDAEKAQENYQKAEDLGYRQ